MSKHDDFMDAVRYFLYNHESPYDRVKALCQECEGVYWVEPSHRGMIAHCGEHPPLSELR